jgi:methylase of polypeptide subunit release factors
MVLFDICSGKGFTALLLSKAFPLARVVMIDSDAVMNTRSDLTQF